MRIAVIGAGAVGTAVAAGLSHAGADVVLVARGRRLEQLRRGAVQVQSGGSVFSASLRCVAANELAGWADLAICCVKAPDLPTALAALDGAQAPGGMILTLQNGVEAHLLAAVRFPDRTILAARLHGFFELEDAMVRHVGVPPSLAVGCIGSENPAAEIAVEQAFAGSGFSVEAVSDIQLALWDKFMLAASLGGVGLALGVPAGRICDGAQGRLLLLSAMQDVATVARLSGVGLGPAEVEAAMAFAETFPPDATTSLQRDVEAGLVSEYDALVGAVCRIGARHGFEPPTFTCLQEMIAARKGGAAPRD